MHAGESVVDVILRQHHLPYPREVLRFVFLYPENLRGGKACKGNICGVCGESVLSDDLVEIIGLLYRAAVIPENAWTNDIVVFVQDDKTMHLAAAADALYFLRVDACGQFLQTFDRCGPPVFRVLLGPAVVQKLQWISFRNCVLDSAGFIHQQEFYG